MPLSPAIVTFESLKKARNQKRVGIFLRAEWRHLAMLNYVIDPEILAPLVPFGTELDLYNGEAYVSIVAFLFLKTRVLGVAIPFHCNFEEVNLRFYIRRVEGSELKRAVCFIQEVVPRRAIAFLANALYNEKYRVGRMAHRILDRSGTVDLDYQWNVGGTQHSLSATAQGEPKPLDAGSLNAFIAEHYWGYAAQRDGSSMEYSVHHSSWLIRPITKLDLAVDVAGLYGPVFADALSQQPRSSFLAEGSAVTVSPGRRISPRALLGQPPSNLRRDLRLLR